MDYPYQAEDGRDINQRENSMINVLDLSSLYWTFYELWY